MKIKINRKYDVISVGNAVIDIFSVVDNRTLKRQNIEPGSMCLITEKKANLLKQILPHNKTFAGGSAANTAIGIGSFGGKVGFVGKIHDDLGGKLFHENMIKNSVEFFGSITKTGASTGKSFVLIAPDGKERTMLTYLGAASELSADDINENAIKNSKILFIEGYLWDVENSRQAAFCALKIAVKHKVKIAFSLSDKFCVERHKSDFQNLIFTKVDILFGNKTEAFAMFGTDNLDGLIEIVKEKCNFAIFTLGSSGTILINKNNICRMSAKKIDNIVDNTGAGDLFASGVLYGLSQELNLHRCGELGNLAAAENISHISSCPNVSLKSLL